MNQVNPRIDALLHNEQGLCMTLILNTESGHENRAFFITQYKKMLRDLETQLQSQLKEPQRLLFLAPLKALADDLPFWLELKQSLIIYRSSTIISTFKLSHAYPNKLVLEPQFYLKYVLTMDEQKPFYVLVISKNQVHFYHGNANLTEIDLPKLPQAIKDVSESKGLKYRQQYHSAGTHSTYSAGYSAFYSGIGEADDERREDLMRFLKAIDTQVCLYLKDTKASLILVGVDYVTSLYRLSSSYHHIVNKGLKDHLYANDLNRLYQDCSALYNAHQKSILKHLENDKRPVIYGLKEIINAAHNGRIEVFYLNNYDAKHDKTLEECARLVMAYKGELSEFKLNAAILRY
ncbi:MAG: hypothetical protein WCI62_00360 [Erysipelotrichaceae bacterium]